MKLTKSFWNISFRIVISLLTAFYLEVHGKDLDFIARAIRQPNFYLALATSFAAAYVIVYYIHWISLFLDRKIDWRMQYAKRGFIQGLLGVVIPVAFDLVFATASMLLDPKHFNGNEFFSIDLPLVVALIVSLNLIYVIRSLKSEPMLKSENRSTELEEAPTILVRYGMNSKKLDVKRDILYFYLLRPNVMIVTSEREYSLGRSSINKMEQQYSSFGFCRISSRTLVNMSIVKDVFPASNRYNYKLDFFEPSIVPDPDSDNLLVKGQYSEMVIAQLKRN